MRLPYLTPLLFSCICNAASTNGPSPPPGRKPALPGFDIKTPSNAGITKSTNLQSSKSTSKIDKIDHTLAIFQRDVQSFISLLNQRSYTPAAFLELSQLIAHTVLALKSCKLSSHLEKEVFMSLSDYLINARNDGAFNIIGRQFIAGLDSGSKRSLMDALVKKYRIMHHYDIPYAYSSLSSIAYPYYRTHSSSRPFTLFGPLILTGDMHEKIMLLLWAFDFLVVFEGGEVTEYQLDYIRFFTEELKPAANLIAHYCGIVIGLFRPVNSIFADTAVLKKLGRNFEKYFGTQIAVATEEYLTSECDVPNIISSLNCLYAMRFYDHDTILKVIEHWEAKVPNGLYSAAKEQLHKVYRCFHRGVPLKHEESGILERHSYLTLFLANNRRIYKDEASLHEQPYSPFQVILNNDLSEATVRFLTGTLLATFNVKLLRQKILCVYAALLQAFQENNTTMLLRIHRAFSDPIFSNTITRASQDFNIEVFTKKLPAWLAEHSNK